ncbi:MAG: NAD(P)H-hydrate epimerase [Cyclobacteriaceae bacterium]
MITGKPNIIPRFEGSIPTLTTAQMIEVDRLMIEEYKIELIQMMENAGRCLAILARDRFLEEPAAGKKIVVLAGTGGNGGGALVCARRLSSWGFDVEVFLTHEDRMTPVPQHQLDILKQMGLLVKSCEELDKDRKTNLIIDGIIGYSLKGAPRGAAKDMIHWANNSSAPILSLDTPSGIDLTSGTVYDLVIKAEATLTLALPKKGLYESSAKSLRGELYLGDISVPPSLYKEPSLGMDIDNPFEGSDIVRID